MRRRRSVGVLLLSVATMGLTALSAHAASRQAQAHTARTDPPKPTPSDSRFIIILQSSSDPMEQLKASIPAEFQDFEVFNTRRMSEGKTLYDICLGYFAALADAERAQRTLLRRFPNASVIPVPSGSQPVSPQLGR